MFISIQDLFMTESPSRANLIHNQMWAQNDISIALARTHDLEFMLTLSLPWKDRWHLIQSKVSQNRVNPLTFWNRDESVNSYQIST